LKTQKTLVLLFIFSLRRPTEGKNWLRRTTRSKKMTLDQCQTGHFAVQQDGEARGAPELKTIRRGS
jgi:hypothetical protein